MGQDTNTEVASTPTPAPQQDLPIVMYPSDLGSEQYPHALRIEIFERVSGGGTGSTNSATRIPTGRVEKGTQALTNLQGSSGVVTAFTATAGAVGVPVQSDVIELLATTAIVTGNTLFGDRYGLKPVGDIYLHINDAPSVSYGASWSEKSLFLSGSATNSKNLDELYRAFSIQKGEGPKDYLTNLVTGVTDAISSENGEMIDYLINQQAQQESPFGSFGTSFNVQAGFALNPFKAQVFNGHPYRTFTFKYKFLPKNPQEAESVQKIIKNLKRYMHGTYNGLKIVYPGEFKISHIYSVNNEEKLNTALFKTKNCALTKLDITYGEGDYVSFKDGSPVETNITMTFTELELLSASDLQTAGY